MLALVQESGPKLTDWLTAVGGLLVFAATVALAFLAYRQMRTLAAQAKAAQEQVHVMREVASDEAAAVREQIDASVALAKSSADTASAARAQIELLRDQTEAAKRQSEVAEAALSASVRPLLVDIPSHTMRPAQMAPWNLDESGQPQKRELDISEIAADVTGRGAWLRVPIRNVGAGVARVLAASVTLKHPIGGAVVSGTVPSVVVNGEYGRVLFWVPPGFEENDPLTHLLRSNETLIVEVAYSDLAGRQETATSLTLSKTGPDYRVIDVEPEHPRRLTAS